MPVMRNILYRINSKLDMAEDKISEFEGRVMETIQNETQREKRIPPN